MALCCGDSALADDLAQESYTKAYLSCDDFSNPEKFNAWIHRIGYNTFLNHKRGERLTSSYTEAAAIPAEAESDSAFRYQALYEALDRLNPKEWTCVLLYYMAGYSVKEIVEIQETTQDAVKQHLSRGRTHLRGLLTPD